MLSAPRRRPLTVLGTLGLAAGLAASLAACSLLPAPAPSATPTEEAPAAPAELVPGGSAEENLPYFDQVNRATLAAAPEARGREFIDGLVAAGFERPAMQVSFDNTTLGKPVDSIQFSVRLGESCLLGQNGPAVGGYVSAVQPILSTGSCLIGGTRPIDW